MRSALPREQKGAALFLVLVLMVAMVWFAMSALRISRQNLHIVGNRQAETQATAVAQHAIEQTISSDQFSKNPAAVGAIPIPTDIDGDGIRH